MFEWKHTAGQPQSAMATLIDSLDVLENLRNQPPFNYFNGKVVALVFVGVPEDLYLVQLATKEEVYVFDCVTLGAKEVCDFLRPLLVNKNILKLIHDLHHTAAALKSLGNIDTVHGMFDTQIAVESKTRKVHTTVHQMLQQFAIPRKFNGKRLTFKHALGAIENAFVKRPLDNRLLFLAYEDTRVFLDVYKKMSTELGSNMLTSIQVASDARAWYAAIAGGERNVCFDHTMSYRLSSYELLMEIHPESVVASSLPIVYNDPSPLIKLLPEEFATWLLDRSESLFEIVLDKGRTPTAWIGRKRMAIGGNDTTRMVSESDIAYVVNQLGHFGSCNRAGLERQLHRIAAIRNRNRDITGLTMRVGRHVSGNAYIISDLLYAYPSSSILFVGEPGSGKTTVVREVTRLLADSFNVCIVDTSNEIAGDGDVPHPCVGHARRMMVPSLDLQSTVMVECVQNHTPEVIVIDEIGRINEVEAARTCKNRGVRLIASAHGDFRQLIKNPKLKGLIGGVEKVTIGDEEAKAEAAKHGRCMQKTKSERGGAPTFEIIVELKRGAYRDWTIILDSGDAVDKVLAGEEYPIQRRTQNPETGAMHVVYDKA
jgi:stage III sporulation protein SpoIIIAA